MRRAKSSPFAHSPIQKSKNYCQASEGFSGEEEDFKFDASTLPTAGTI